MCQKPWQVLIDCGEYGLYLRVREHIHGSIAFSERAVAECGGEAERDCDGYVVRCKEENELVEEAREIARMSEWKGGK